MFWIKTLDFILLFFFIVVLSCYYLFNSFSISVDFQNLKCDIVIAHIYRVIKIALANCLMFSCFPRQVCNTSDVDTKFSLSDWWLLTVIDTFAFTLHDYLATFNSNKQSTKSSWSRVTSLLQFGQWKIFDKGIWSTEKNFGLSIFDSVLTIW